jgi:hypothetical protein
MLPYLLADTALPAVYFAAQAYACAPEHPELLDEWKPPEPRTHAGTGGRSDLRRTAASVVGL